MLFNSFAFAIFLSIVFIVYWVMPSKYRWTVLLGASYYFYLSWGVKYIWILLSTTAISYGCAILMEKVDSVRKKKNICAFSIVMTLALLVIFKYFNFFSGALSDVLRAMSIPVQGITLKLILPVGISFYTFQTVGYLLDVYRGKVAAERHFGMYALFVSFFPRLVAGPIERAGNLLPQLRENKKFSYDSATYGLKLMAIGFFKKLVIADNISRYVDIVFNDVGQHTGFALVVAGLLFTVQIYCDFSGYSDIAIGASRLLSINLVPNFKSPYFSFSIREFWSRWHMSLSTWFRDYLYIPLGGNRVGKVRHHINLMITFIVSGFWHGANWTFLIWGGLHGLYQVIENVLFPWRKKSPLGKKAETGKLVGCLSGIWWIFNVIITFLLVSFAWIFFRANSIQDAYYFIYNMFNGLGDIHNYIYKGYALFGSVDLVIYIGLPILVLIIYELASINMEFMLKIKSKPFIIRWMFYLFLMIIILVFSDKGEGATFVYAKF